MKWNKTAIPYFSDYMYNNNNYVLHNEVHQIARVQGWARLQDMTSFAIDRYQNLWARQWSRMVQPILAHFWLVIREVIIISYL